MAIPRRGYVDGVFGQIHYRISKPEDAAKAPPLYCLHQSPKSSLEFEKFMVAASKDRTVVAPDYPGYGMSDAPPEEAQATIPAYAEAMWTVADALGHDLIDLFGNHTGAKVATEMTVNRPLSVGGISMISAAVLTKEERAAFEDMFLPIPLDETNTRMKIGWERILERRSSETPLETLDRSLYMNMMGGEAYEWGHAAAFAYDEPFIEALKTLDHRMTILNPADDLQEATRRAEPLLKNGEIIELPQWGYNFMSDSPETVAEILLPKLDAGQQR